MGSLSSSPKIMNSDDQDNDLQMPRDISRKELLQFCRLHGNRHDLLKRTFKKKPLLDATGDATFVRHPQTDSYDPSNPFVLRVFQWNVLSQGTLIPNLFRDVVG